MIKRLIATKIGMLYINWFIRLHKYLKIGFKIKPEIYRGLFADDLQIIGLNVDLYLGLITLMFNVNIGWERKQHGEVLRCG